MDREKFKELLEPVDDDLREFDRITEEVLSSESELISGVIFHLLKKKGKRIRPAISFLISRAAGLTHPNMVKAALAIELIHSATLLHDDVVDDSGTRRGQTTVNYKWNNLVAVLMGDYFFAKAFRLLVETESSNLVAQVSKATEQVSYGELRQIEESFNWDLDENEYYRIIGDKTAALFSASSASCAILCRKDNSQIANFSGFGNNVGTAFQIADDILDLVGTTNKTGKEVGLDLLQGKVTLPLIYTLREGDNSEKNNILAILNNGLNEDSLDRIVSFINSEGGVEYARSRAADYGQKALDFIRGFPESDYSRSLEEIIHFTIDRDN